MKLLLNFFSIALSIALLAPAAVYAAPPPWEVEELLNKSAPEFSLHKLDDTPLSLSSLKGKTVLLNFWATWCGPCLAEMPSLNQLYQQFKQKDFLVIAVSIDENKSAILHFLKKASFDFIIVHDKALTAAEAYKVFAYPTSFLIDRKGILRKKYIGEQNWVANELVEEINGFVNH
jgi:peroxiredoxin